MSLAHDEPIAVRPLRSVRIESEGSSVECSQQVRCGQRTSDMRRISLARHANTVLPDALSKLGEIHCVSRNHILAFLVGSEKQERFFIHPARNGIEQLCSRNTIGDAMIES